MSDGSDLAANPYPLIDKAGFAIRVIVCPDSFDIAMEYG